LQKAGYKVAVKTSTSNSVTNGNVISQSPGGGATAATGVTVTIVVSTGSSQVSLPNVVGQTSTNAQNTLTEAGFQVLVSGSTSGTGTVESQSPGAGTKVDPKSTVTIVVGP
jgi:serine/threonine-protein kinase